MNRSLILRAASALAGLALLSGRPALALPACTASLPQGLSAAPVGSDVVADGLAMTISQVQGREDPAAILQRTEAAWKEAGYDVRRSETAGWQVLSALGQRCLLTLQLTQRNGAFGYLARGSKAAVALSAAGMGIAPPPGASITSSVASNDDGRRGLVLAMSSSQSLDQLNQYFLEQLASKHWSAARSHKVIDKRSGASSLFLSAQRERQQVEIVLWPERGTQIVMTVSDAL